VSYRTIGTVRQTEELEVQNPLYKEEDDDLSVSLSHIRILTNGHADEPTVTVNGSS